MADADLVDIPPAMRTGPSGKILVVVTDGLAVATWQCVLTTGGSCGGTPTGTASPSGFSRDAQVVTDPSGSGRQLIGQFPNSMQPLGDAREVTIVLLDARGDEVGRVVVPTS